MPSITIASPVTYDVLYLEIDVRPRYWEDAVVDGVRDTEGELVPFRVGDSWKIKINLENGYVLEWPIGCTAKVHYKVAGDGEYWLLDSAGDRVARCEGYTPPHVLNYGERGSHSSDYVVMEIDENGKIVDFEKPVFGRDDGWEPT